MPKVFVVSKGFHNYEEAKNYGELVYLSTQPVDKLDVSRMLRIFAPILDKSNPDDYILPAGYSIMTALACSYFAVKHGGLNLLLFHKNVYVPRRILIHELSGFSSGT